jgi:hypothetical protein
MILYLETDYLVKQINVSQSEITINCFIYDKNILRPISWKHFSVKKF